MKISTGIFFAFGALMLWGISKRKFIKSLSFGFQKIDFNKKKKAIVVFFSVTNPTNQSLIIDSITGTLFMNGKEVATVTNFEAQKIASKGASTIRVDMKPSLSSIFIQIVNFFTAKKTTTKKTASKKVKAIFEGFANVQGSTFPIKSTLFG